MYTEPKKDTQQLGTGIFTREYAPVTAPLPVALETPHEPFWKETWFYEQCVYVILLSVAVYGSYSLLSAKGPVSPRDIVLLAGSTTLQFVAQKTRSAATRQAALDQKIKKIGGPKQQAIRCAAKIKFWSHVGQVLGAFMGVATAPSRWHLPLVLWGLFIYSAWRAYRENKKGVR